MNIYDIDFVPIKRKIKTFVTVSPQLGVMRYSKERNMRVHIVAFGVLLSINFNTVLQSCDENAKTKSVPGSVERI